MSRPAVTLPLFKEPARVSKPKNPSVRSVAWGNCPGCRKGRVGIIRGSIHLMWRHHTYITWSGARLSCPASAVPVCQLGECAPTLLVDSPVQCSGETPPETPAESLRPGRRR